MNNQTLISNMTDVNVLKEYLTTNNIQHEVDNNGVIQMNWTDYYNLLKSNPQYNEMFGEHDDANEDTDDEEYFTPKITVNKDSFKFLTFHN